MNRIYKTIKKSLTGETVAASEHSKSQGSVQKATQNTTPLVGMTIGTMLLTAFGSSAWAQQMTYDGNTGADKASLEAANVLGLDQRPWLGINASGQGLIYRNNSNSTVISGADLVVNYTSPTPAPAFVIGGYSNVPGDEVTGNRVIITRGAVNGSVLGGLSQTTQIQALKDTTTSAGSPNTSESAAITLNNNQANTNDNTVLFDSTGNITGDIYGGDATIWMHAGNVTTGNATAANADSNASANASLSSYLSTVTANDNEVIIGHSRTVGGTVYGGYVQLFAQAANASAGSATVTGAAKAEAQANAYVEISSVTSAASGNKVTIGNNGTANDAFYGGYVQLSARGGEATSRETSGGNSFATSRANTSTGITYSTATANSNEVTVGDNSAVSGALHGGHVTLSVQAAQSTAGNATSPNATNGNANASAYANVSASNSTITASGNKVTVGENTTIGSHAYGGYAQIFAQAKDAIAGNASGGVSSSAQANARTEVMSSTITANSNIVTVGQGSSVMGSLHGGYAALVASAGTATGGLKNGAPDTAIATLNALSTKVFANDNAVTFDGTLQNGSLYGGYAQFDITQGTATKADNTPGNNSVNLTNTTAQATGNTVTIGDNAQFNGAGSLYGGFLAYNTADNIKPASYDVFTGNTLDWSAKAPATFQTVANFENYNFTINPAYRNSSTSLITAQDIVLGTDASNISTGTATPSNVAVIGIHSGNVLNAGDQFILMNATNSMTGNGNSGIDNVTQAQQGISLLYDVQTTVDTGNKQVTATILGCQTSIGGVCSSNSVGGSGSIPAARVNPQLKALSEGYLAVSQLVMRGADLMADEAVNAINVQNNKNGWVPFAISSAQHNRYNSGSHIDSNDFLLTGGLSYQQDNLTVGILAEAGWGNYDSHNSFYNAANVKGDGNDRYVGAGVLARYDFDSGFYANASLRFGRYHNKFNTQDIRNMATGQHASYTVNNNYVSAHVGAGYIVPLDDKNELDLSAKYLWTQLSGADVNVAGDPIHFDRINSHRARLNATLNHQYNQALTLNAGLSYEHEFDGKASATTYGIYAIEAPSLRGGTGIVSVGANIKPTPNQRLSLDIKANGYGGKREGIGASIRLNYAF